MNMDQEFDENRCVEESRVCASEWMGVTEGWKKIT
jgi:hypothetical protein